jgi:hypothetical protein
MGFGPLKCFVLFYYCDDDSYFRRRVRFYSSRNLHSFTTMQCRYQQNRVSKLFTGHEMPLELTYETYSSSFDLRRVSSSHLYFLIRLSV